MVRARCDIEREPSGTGAEPVRSRAYGINITAYETRWTPARVLLRV